MNGFRAPGFTDYSPEAVRNQLIKSLAYFRPNVSREMARQVLGLFESFPCETGKK